MSEAVFDTPGDLIDRLRVAADRVQLAALTPAGDMKTGMRGAYKKVSPRYLQSYLDEYAWRHSAKRSGPALFEQLLLRAAE